MEQILIKTFQLLFSLSILVVVHEFGHFLFAKIFKTRVEKFYLFFDYKFSLFKKKIGETEYGIGWIPLGGYVKIAGMIDESMDKEQLKQEAQPDEYRSKPAWQRFFMIIGGVLFNLILAIVIYIITLNVFGTEYLPTKNVKYGITCDSLAKEIGLKNGDYIVKVGGNEVENFFKIPETIILNNVKDITVKRNDSIINIDIPNGFLSKFLKNAKTPFINIRFPFKVGEFAKKSVGEKAGIEKGDLIIGVNDVKTEYFDEFRDEIQKHKNSLVNISIVRKNEKLNIPVNLDETGLLGIAPDPTSFFEYKRQEYNIIQAIPAGITKAYTTTVSYIKQLKLLFNPEVKAYDSVGGFITIGSIFPSTWNWETFWALTAFLSIILAIMNILPIPALDGGHLIFILYEMITKRKPSDKFLERAQMVGMILLITLLVWANLNDILKLFR
ncbi:MAG: RIP metalloprotease RseP [Bacteroidetes bacterium GWE2_29_8]|nr:MAG: RIP metalloprotease RseP [Bacteroidetes bacterium GWE2_29_8]OFY17710.1 MAG: RIP metalloprotease RseP [Bacteroidetes bacterium GWF2_29_10]